MLISVLLVSFFLLEVKSQNNRCKNPYVEQRLLKPDVEYASPFYVIALPRTQDTQQMDNVCYTYFHKNGSDEFFHVMSVTYKNGSNVHYEFSKGDIANRMGIAEAKSEECVYHDYTLKPICNSSVFILYRCYIKGSCSSNIDIGPISGVDVRVTLAANPKVSPECQAETESSLRNTNELDGGDYVILPRKMEPICITIYDEMKSIGIERSVGRKETVYSKNVFNRFEDPDLTPTVPAPTSTSYGTASNRDVFQQAANHGSGSQKNPTRQGVPPPAAYNPYGHPAPYSPPRNVPSSDYKGQTLTNGNGYSTNNAGINNAFVGAGQTPTPMRPNSVHGPSQWGGQTPIPGAEIHHHIWQPFGSIASLREQFSAWNISNVHFHIHSFPYCNCPQGQAPSNYNTLYKQ